MTQHNRTGFLRGLTAAASILAVTAYSGAASAQQAEPRRIEIEAQALDTALVEIGQRYGIVVVASEALTAGRTAAAVTGLLTAEEALDRLLAGSGLAAERSETGAYILVRRAAARSGAPRLLDTAPVPDRIVVVGATTDIAITAADLERQQANDLADIFRLTPSVSVGGSVGVAQKVYIRGLEDTLLNVTVDGAPQTGTLFHHIGRVSVDPELLKQVEVQSGAGEATAGFGAIGGAIRFQTKDPLELIDRDRRFGAIGRLGYFTNEGQRASATGYGLLSENWGVLASIVHVDRENMEDGDGEELLGTGAEQTLGFVKLSGEPAAGQRLSLSYEQRQEEGEFGQRPNWPALEGATLYPVDAERRTAVANYQVAASSLVNLEATGYWTETSFEQDIFDRWGLYGAEITTTGFDLRNTSHLGAHELVFGVERRVDEVTSQYLSPASVWQDWAWDPSLGAFKESGELWGVYVQDHFQVLDPLLLSFGLRYDSYDLDQDTYGDATSSEGWSGNIGALYEITRDLSLTVGYAEAMRGKEIGDAFTLERRPGRITLAPGLEPEEVANTEVGLVYDNGPFIASASYYSMKIENVILDQLGGGPAPQDAIYYENVGELEADGFELRLGYVWEKLSADLFFTTSDSELNGHTVEGYEEIGLGNASGDRWSLNLNYDLSPRLNAGWNIVRLEDLNDITVLYRAVEIGWIDALQTVDKPGYTVHDIYAEWLPAGNDAVSLTFAVQNLFDEAYRDHASVADYNHIPDWEGVAGVREAGRDIRVTLSLRY